MATEIELKYLIFNDNIINNITILLNKNNINFIRSTKRLVNCYFDTPTLALRRADLGLRVRTSGNNHEQTIKTSGKMVGGLYKRPEYNIDINDNVPDLSLFSEHIWVSSKNEMRDEGIFDIAQLQAQLFPLFNTNFERVMWLVKGENGSQIELVFDDGNIVVDGVSEPICELELELLTGDTEDLFSLAHLLVQNFLLRPGIKSKAARGYQLYSEKVSENEAVATYQQAKAHSVVTLKNASLELIPIKTVYHIKQSFVVGLEFSLNQLQKMVEVYSDKPSLKILAKITELLALIRHGFWLFEDYLPSNMENIRSDISQLIKRFSWLENAIYFQELTDKKGNYRKKLAYSEQLIRQLKFEKSQFPTAKDVIAIFHSAHFNTVQLALIKLSLLLDERYDKQMVEQDELLFFAQDKLEASLTLLMNNLMQHQSLTLNEYLSQQKLLIRSLLTGSWFGNLYDKDERLEFRNPWLDVKEGMDELHTLLIIQEQLAGITDKKSEKTHRWLESKIETLLLALDCSRSNAMKIVPYWR